MPAILVEDVGSVRVLRLNRPAVKNAMNRALRLALRDALATAAAEPDVRALVLTGEGDAFCSGMDLAELEANRSLSSAEQRADSRALADLLLELSQLPKPVVAAVNGPAVAGGAGLVSACDVAVMAASASIGYTEARIGFVAALVSVFLLRQVGEKRARDLLLSARLISAREAAEMGLVNEVCEGGAVLERALAVATGMARNAPGSLAMTKVLLSTLPGMGMEDALRFAVEMNAMARVGDEISEGVQAFLEKRAPSWNRSDGA